MVTVLVGYKDCVEDFCRRRCLFESTRQLFAGGSRIDQNPRLGAAHQVAFPREPLASTWKNRGIRLYP